MTGKLLISESSQNHTHQESETNGHGPINVWLVGQQASPSQRRNRYVQELFSHPAMMLPELARQIIERS